MREKSGPGRPRMSVFVLAARVPAARPAGPFQTRAQRSRSRRDARSCTSPHHDGQARRQARAVPPASWRDCVCVDLPELFRHFRACHGASIEGWLSLIAQPVDRFHGRTLASFRTSRHERNAIPLPCGSRGDQRLSREVGEHLSRGRTMVGRDLLGRLQYVIVNIQRGSHAPSITHHASDVKGRVLRHRPWFSYFEILSLTPARPPRSG